MRVLRKKDARAIMSLYATLVILGVIDIEQFLEKMLEVEELVGVHPEYISEWEQQQLHLYDLLDDDDLIDD